MEAEFEIQLIKERIIPVLNIDRIKEISISKAKKPNGRLKTSVLRAKNILKILERDNFTCVECHGKENLTIDHTNGRAFAKHDNHLKYKLNKCRTLCMSCHINKNIKDDEELKINEVMKINENEINENKIMEL